MDVNTKSLIKNAYRVTRKRGLTALRVRVPGGHLPAKHLAAIQHIADRYGPGAFPGQRPESTTGSKRRPRRMNSAKGASLGCPGILFL